MLDKNKGAIFLHTHPPLSIFCPPLSICRRGGAKINTSKSFLRIWREQKRFFIRDWPSSRAKFPQILLEKNSKLCICNKLKNQFWQTSRIPSSFNLSKCPHNWLVHSLECNNICHQFHDIYLYMTAISCYFNLRLMMEEFDLSVESISLIFIQVLIRQSWNWCVVFTPEPYGPEYYLYKIHGFWNLNSKY